jgi:uncharacterized protein YecE (DUF72 family)
MAHKAGRSAIRIGTSGYSFADWKGEVYPANIKEKDMLPYYEQELGFDALEVNFTYYRQPQARTIEGMSRKTSDGFLFVVKGHKTMTHEMLDPETREYVDNSADFEVFFGGLRPMAQAGKLFCVLAQFPPYFVPNTPAFDYMRRFKENCGEVPLAVEFRNKAWMRPETFEFLTEENIIHTIVDEPKFPSLMPFLPERTSEISYFRMHGRSPNWYKGAAQRYDYMYSPKELNEFVPSIHELAGQSRTTLVFFNNCHAGAAARNAAMMKELLGIEAEGKAQRRLIEVAGEKGAAKESGE